jgi:hypothetical protein
MKRVLFLMVLCLLVLGMKAQTTESTQKYLLGLWFGDSFEECDESLAKKGFSYDGYNNNGRDIYTSDGSVILSLDIYDVEINFGGATDALTDWVVWFNRSTDYDVELKVTTLLNSLHGESTYYKDEGFYYWEFDENHVLYAGFNDDGDSFYASFETIVED